MKSIFRNGLFVAAGLIMASSATAELPTSISPQTSEAIVYVGPQSPATDLSQNEIRFEYQVQRKNNGEFVRITFNEPRMVSSITLKAISDLARAGIQVLGVHLELESGLQLPIEDLDSFSITDSSPAEKKGFPFVSAGETRTWRFPFLAVKQLVFHVEGWSSNDISLQLFVEVVNDQTLVAWQDFQAHRERNYTGTKTPFETMALPQDENIDYSAICIQNQLTWKSRLTAEELVACDRITNAFAAACVTNQTTDYGRSPDVEEIQACAQVTTAAEVQDIKALNRDTEEEAYRPDALEIIAVLVAHSLR